MRPRKLDAAAITSNISPLDFYRHELPGIKFKKHGWNSGGICPFHPDKKPGSFHVNLESGGYICFSCGTKGGDVIAFTMTLHGIEFVDALAKLAREWLGE